MRSIITSTLLCFVTLAFSQTTQTHKLELGAGKEWNAFLSPELLIDEDERILRDELWDNGSFQAVALSNSFKYEKGAHKLKFKANGSIGIYQTEQKSNRHTYTLGASYRVKYAPKKYFEFAPELFRKKRAGINAADAVIQTPFSFIRFLAPVKLDFYLGNKSWLKTEFGYLYKDYDKSNGEVLTYHAPLAGISFSKKWEAEKTIHKLTLKGQSQFRKYQTRDLRTTEEFDEEDDEEEFEIPEAEFRNGTRTWTYLFNSLNYDVSSSNKKTSFTIGVNHRARLDAENRSSYHEIGPGLKLSHRLGKIRVTSAFSYSFRNYLQLSQGEGNNRLLRYEYLRAKFGLDLSVRKNTILYLRGNLVNRESNNPDQSSMRFREYFNGSIEAGIRLKW